MMVNKMVKKVLIIAFHFTDDKIIGSLRSRGLAKYLGEYGWQPIIVTAKTDQAICMEQGDFKLIEVPHQSELSRWKARLGWSSELPVRTQKGLRSIKQKDTLFDRILTTLTALFFYPDDLKEWRKNVIDQCSEIFESEDIDAIISTSSPVSSHYIAMKLHNKYRTPWLADYRDLWSQNHYKTSTIRHIRDIASEKMVIQNANALTTVSEPLADDLAVLHPEKPVITILNGYDPDDLNPGISLDEKFRIIYSGSLYQGKRDPGPLFQAISELIEGGDVSRNDVIVDFYGPHEQWLLDDISKFNLSSVVRLHGKISREEVLQEQRKAQILLLLMWDNPKEYGVYTGKLFEYIAAKRPILLIGSKEGVAHRLLSELNIGKSAS
jgi:hypothetical protein